MLIDLSEAAARAAYRQALQAVNSRPDPLSERAQRIWPESAYLQREWLRAVRVARATRRGWLLERPLGKGAPT